MQKKMKGFNHKAMESIQRNNGDVNKMVKEMKVEGDIELTKAERKVYHAHPKEFGHKSDKAASHETRSGSGDEDLKRKL